VATTTKVIVPARYVDEDGNVTVNYQGDQHVFKADNNHVTVANADLNWFLDVIEGSHVPAGTGPAKKD
jgi:putative sterol carrier protein